MTALFGVPRLRGRPPEGGTPNNKRVGFHTFLTSISRIHWRTILGLNGAECGLRFSQRFPHGTETEGGELTEAQASDR
jgi:hypothetical protein